MVLLYTSNNVYVDTQVSNPFSWYIILYVDDGFTGKFFGKRTFGSRGYNGLRLGSNKEDAGNFERIS